MATPIWTPDPSIEPASFAYFYYWYDLPDGPHSGALTQRPAEGEATSYRHVVWFEKQLFDMTEAGVDNALAIYWADAEPSSDTGLVNMNEAASELESEGIDAPQIGMFIDTGFIGRWPEASRDLRDEENIDRLYDSIRRFYTIVDRDHWALIDGKPVVWLWGAYFNIGFDQSTFDYIYSRFGSDFGVEPYIVAEISWFHEAPEDGITVDDYYTWGASLLGFEEPIGNIAEVGPGYDERELTGPGRTGRFAERDGGDFYRDAFQGAIDSGRPIVAIETWNEFHEASGVADSVEYGRDYIELTRELVAALKAAVTSR
ncbi:MAG TPA: DUF5010 domain-containing protein [Dehalococcoidia bacterium]